jgi:hypothetical protein
LLLALFSRLLAVFTPVARNTPLKQLKFMAHGKERLCLLAAFVDAIPGMLAVWTLFLKLATPVTTLSH